MTGTAEAPGVAERHRGRTAPLELLWESAEVSGVPGGHDTVRGDSMPQPLRERYGGPLTVPMRPDRPTVLVNFVSTLDGVVALGTDEKTGGGAISGFYEPDRFVMGLLRAVADVVIVGAGTVRASPRAEWTARRIHPASAAEFAQWRDAMGLAAQPTTIIVSRSGDLDITRRRLVATDVPTVVLTTSSGAQKLLRAEIPGNVEVVEATDGDRIGPLHILAETERRGARVALCEGGPHLLGDFIADEAADELFLTLAPQIAGHSGDRRRLSLVEGATFEGDDARWLRAVSIRRSGSHLFLRYRYHGKRL